jgi:hypothetical protein
VWNDVITATQSLITSLQARTDTGLLPDFIVNGNPAPPNFLEAATDGDYNYNAGRDPWRLGTDALLNNDPISMAQTRKITRWIRTAANGDPRRIRSGYRIDGTPLPNSDYFSIFFAAPFAVAAMTDSSQQEWLNDLYDAIATTHHDYYEDSVTLLSLLVVTGNMWSAESPVGGRSKRRATARP